MKKPLFAAFAVCLCLPLLAAEAPLEPKVAPASPEAEQAIKGFRIPGGLRVRLAAAEPLVANPVAFCLDEKGRIYVAETFRQGNAVTDNRDRMYWLDDDLAAMTVEDRLAYHQKHLKDKLADFTRQDDRIRRLEDRDGDGLMDAATVFSSRYNDAVEGTGAGVLARQGKVFYTNIPNLWQLADTNDDGQADDRTSLLQGFGVRVAFRGHDLHGLRIGPDGRLYFSIGDRGFNVKTPQRHYVFPDQGAVFRCELDGSNLEVVHQGLRNPQELAFDNYGNLFTGDNNSDSGDRARWVQIVEGGDSGWRMSFQYLSDRGPWNREKMWHPAWEGQPAFLVPPITNFADGPSGLAHDPGVGLPDKYRDHFFLCDFRGGPANSGVRSFAVKPKGASFELVDATEFAWNILATDVDFGPDGTMYVSDWVNGWNGDGKGRLYRIDDPTVADSAMAKLSRQLMAEGFNQRTPEELSRLLDHPSQQIRQEAQFALASRGRESIPVFAAVLHAGMADRSRFARLHALWGLGQISRQPQSAKESLEPVLAALGQSDPILRKTAVSVLGDLAGRPEGTTAPLPLALLHDPSDQVRFEAAIGAGKILGPAAIPGLVDLLRANADKDPYLRHAGVMGLYYACNKTRDVLQEPVFNPEPLGPALSDSSGAVRLAALLVLRKYRQPAVAKFLHDADPRIVEEAARAIHDLLIADAVPELAAIAGRQGLSEPALWRTISANFRLGTAEAATRLASLAGNTELPDAIRLEALRALGDWAKPSGRDRVMGLWRPLPERDAQPATDALRLVIARLLQGSEALRKTAVEVAGKLNIREIGPTLVKIVGDAKQPLSARIESLRTLALLKDPNLPETVDAAIESDQPRLRAAARSEFAKSQPQAAFQLLKEVLTEGDIVEQQAALSTLGWLKNPESEAVLVEWMERLKAGQVRPELQLDLLEAAAANSERTKSLAAEFDRQRKPGDVLSQYGEALAGGDAEAGRRLFLEKTSLSCVRCHKIGDQGGEVGPNLSGIALQQQRDYVLTSLVDPNKQIAKGFEGINVATLSGLVHTGIVKADDGKTLTLITAEAKLVTIKKDEIDEQTSAKSAMPEDLIKKMSRRELRDLVEFLMQQKTKVDVR